MSRNFCPQETELLLSLELKQWPEACALELRDHVAACSDCGELLLVASALLEDPLSHEARARVPSFAATSWRIRLRAEREGREKAARTVRMAHGISLTATIVFAIAALVATSLLGRGWKWIVMAGGENGWLAALLHAAPLLTLIAVAGWILFTPVALYVALGED